jgi:hypothetical protein
VVCAFDPYINKTDRYLANWQASLLNPMGRTVLINVVLDGQLSYLMDTIPLPAGVIAQFDKRCRDFIWTGNDHARGASCLVAWDTVRRPREHGGLGIMDVGVKNSCQLLQLVNRLHRAATSSWAR